MFLLFDKFLTEIATEVWQQVLRRHHIVGITVMETENETESPPQPYTTKNGLGNIISVEGYQLNVTTTHQLTPLLQVNFQSRKIALEFYYIHMPYDLNGAGEQKCLYLSPEYDFWHLRIDNSPNILVDFIYDAKAYDPLGRGIEKLVIGHGSYLEFILPTGMIPPKLLCCGSPLMRSAICRTRNLRRLSSSRNRIWRQSWMWQSTDLSLGCIIFQGR